MVFKSEPKKEEPRQPRPVEQERILFRSLILQNPNFFGNLKGSAFKAVKSIASNTTYEELKCVGFQPQLNRLEAVVWVKQAAGYSGGICTAGSPEYVRFWLSFDDGATWQDQGMESFTAYDIPGDQPLEYAVSLAITPRRRLCFRENLPLVRAILSWSAPPTDPLTPPVWGNVLDTRIQIEPLHFIDFPDLLHDFEVKLPVGIEKVIDLSQPLALKKPLALSAAQLQTAYSGKDVPAHRFLYHEIRQHITHPELAASLTQPQSLLPELNLNFAKIFESLFATNGDTSYEELSCIGLDPNSTTPDALIGTIRIKRPAGYLGSLCDAGSIEYVGFWIDCDGVWQWVGTAQVRVHDISRLPAEGLSYAVYQPVNLEEHRRPCTQGPVTARVRAILSWNQAPPPANPEYVPRWGNRLETRIHIYPGVPAVTGDYTPYMQNLCGIALCNIDQTTGFAPGQRPFGGSVLIFGHIPGAPNVLTPEAQRPRYRVSVRPVVGGLPVDPPQYLNDGFGLTVDEQIGAALPTSTNITQSAGAGDYYVYQDAPPVAGAGWRTVSPSRLLAVWNSGGKTGLWEIKIEAQDPVTLTTYVAGTVVCTADGTHRQNVVVDLDQAAPVASLGITGYQRGGTGPVLTDILNCGTFQVGDLLHGSYSVTDEHFHSLSLTAEPTPDGAPGRFTIDGLATAVRSYPAIPTTGKTDGKWTFNTAGLDPCGYTIQLSASDRTIVSCSGGWTDNNNFIGFCLVAAAKK